MMNGNGKQEDITEGFRKQMKEDAQPLRLDTGTYWWIWAIEEGRRIVWGPFQTQEEGTQKAYATLQGDFSVIPLKTRNEVEASRQLRAKVLVETQDVSSTFRRFEHEKGLKRRLEQVRKMLGKKRE